MDEALLLMNKLRKWSLEMESVSSEDAVKSVDMTTKNLDYYINFIDKETAGLRGSTPL